LRRDRIVTAGAERLTPRKTTSGEPGAADHAVAMNGNRGVLRARRQEAAGARKVPRKQQLVSPEQPERKTDADPGLSEIAEGGERGGFGNRLQGRPGWRRGDRAWARRQCRSQQRFCCDGKPLESVVSLCFSEPRRRSSVSPRCRAGQYRARWPART